MKKLLSMVLIMAMLFGTTVFVHAEETGEAADTNANQDVFTMNLDDPNFSVWAPAAKKTGSTISFPTGSFTDGMSVAESSLKMYYKENLNLNDGDLGTIVKGYFLLSETDKDKSDSTLLNTPFIAQNHNGETILSVGYSETHVVGYRFRAPRAGKILIAAAGDGKVMSNTPAYNTMAYNVNVYNNQNGSNSGANTLKDAYGSNNTDAQAANKGSEFTNRTCTVEEGQDIMLCTYKSSGTSSEGKHHIMWTPVVAYIDDLSCEDFTLDNEGNVSFKSNNGSLSADNINLYIKGEDKTPLTVTNFAGGTAADGKTPYSAEIAEESRAKLLPGETYCLQLVKNITYAEGKTHNLTTEVLEITLSGERVRFNAANYLMDSNDTIWTAYKGDIWNPLTQITTLTQQANLATGSYYGKNVYQSTAETIENNATYRASFIDNNYMWVFETGHSGNEALAKVFTAPYAGKIKLEQMSVDDGSNKITSGVANGDNYMVVKISKQVVGQDRKQEGELIRLNKDNNGETEFSPMEIEVSKGDKIYAEVYTDGYIGQNYSYVRFNPVVTYIDEFAASAEFIKIIPAEGEDTATETEITEKSDLADCSKVKVTAERRRFGEDTIHAIPIVAFYNADGSLAKAALGEDLALALPETKNVDIPVSSLPGDVASAKVFLWEGTAEGGLNGSLKPLTSVLKEIK